jgi:hypothetical protein
MLDSLVVRLLQGVSMDKPGGQAAGDDADTEAQIRQRELRQQRDRALAGFAEISPDSDGTIEVGIDQGARVKTVRGQWMFGLALRALFRTREVGVGKLFAVLLHGTGEWV